MKISRRKILLAGLFGVPASGLGAYAYARGPGRKGIVTREVEVPVAGLAAELEGFRIVHMSDFHIDPLIEREHHAKAVALANSLKADAVVLTGDFVTHEGDAISELGGELAKLESRFGVFACLGNHDGWTAPGKVARGLEKAGIRVFKNDGVSLRDEGVPLFVGGVDSVWAGHADPGKAVEGQGGDEATVMLCHEPDLFYKVAGEVPITLMVSGHTHGGQVRFPGVGALILPRFGKRYVRGLYAKDGARLHVNPGVGTVDHHVRLFCRPEVTCLVLKREKFTI